MTDESRCKCGEPHDDWPGEDGGQLCQMCWESECDRSWWAMVNALQGLAEPRKHEGEVKP